MANRFQEQREGEERRWRRTWPDEREEPWRGAEWRYEPYQRMRDEDPFEGEELEGWERRYGRAQPPRRAEGPYEPYRRGPWPERELRYQRTTRGAASPERGVRPDYAGKGPKGYMRSDERILEDVSERFTRSPDLDASDIEIRVTNGEVTLSGTVPERFMKWLAEEMCERTSGVVDVHNEIRPKRPHSLSGQLEQLGETEQEHEGFRAPH